MRDSYANAQYNLNVSPLPTKIAAVEDEGFPGTTHRLPLDKITVTYREHRLSQARPARSESFPAPDV